MAKDIKMQNDSVKTGLLGLTALAVGALTVWLFSDKRRRDDLKDQVDKMKDKSLKLKDKTQDYFSEVKDTLQDKQEQIIG